MAARSSTAIRRPCIAVSTSAPTKCPAEGRRGIPHHLIDIADPTQVYTAAQFASDAAAAIRDIHARGRLPILGRRDRLLLPRADARSLLRAWRGRGACARGSIESRTFAAPRGFTACCGASMPISAAHAIMPRDLKRIVRALEVYYTTGRPLTSHFRRDRDRRSRIAMCCRGCAATAAGADGGTRGARRVDRSVRARHRRRGAGTSRARRAAAGATVRRTSSTGR